LVGVVPFNRDRGQHQGERSIFGGRAHVRAALYIATLTAAHYNPILKPFYEKLCKAGKKKKVALVACMHKLLRIMNAMLKNNRAWHLLT
jgi:transposase